MSAFCQIVPDCRSLFIEYVPDNLVHHDAIWSSERILSERKTRKNIQSIVEPRNWKPLFTQCSDQYIYIVVPQS